MSVSLVISVYNDVLSLAAVLRSVKAQSFQKFEVIIAQDGDDTCFDALINKYNAFFPIQHLKQADEGFLKNRILNEAIRRASYDKMVFIDGDCFLHPHFLKAYNQSIQKGKISMGRRIDLDPKTTALVKDDTATSPPFITMIKNGTTRVEEVFYLPWLSQRFHSRPKLIGCNMGWHKEDLFALNGFDEDYTNPGYGEDSDIEWRAKKQGLKPIPFATMPSNSTSITHVQTERKRYRTAEHYSNRKKPQDCLFVKEGWVDRIMLRTFLSDKN